eukprot:8160701-Pyramimonas_sp.AAC.1
MKSKRSVLPQTTGPRFGYRGFSQPACQLTISQDSQQMLNQIWLGCCGEGVGYTAGVHRLDTTQRFARVLAFRI